MNKGSWIWAAAAGMKLRFKKRWCLHGAEGGSTPAGGKALGLRIQCTLHVLGGMKQSQVFRHNISYYDIFKYYTNDPSNFRWQVINQGFMYISRHPPVSTVQQVRTYCILNLVKVDVSKYLATL